MKPLALQLTSSTAVAQCILGFQLVNLFKSSQLQELNRA
jgi:hypothetical protein